MSTRRNLVASALGNGWSALVQVAFAPVYIALLGVEAYGLIGFYAALQATLWILDLGFTPAVSREVARAAAGARGVDEVRRLLRSIEWVLAAAAAMFVLGIWAAAPWIAREWLRLEALPAVSAVRAVEAMGALVGLRLFVGLHRGAVAGAQRLVWLNAVGSGFSTLRGAGVVAVLWASPTIEAFFLFQLGATALEAAVMARKAWSLLASPRPAVASLASLCEVRRFSGGMLLVTLLYVVLSQADKILLSTTLPLALFGHYALASSVASVLALLAAPIGMVAYPRMNELAARGVALEEPVHGFSQGVTLAVAPAALVLALFAEPILALWTGNPSISAASAQLLACLSVGAMMHAFTTVPCLAPMVHGSTRPLVAAYLALAALYLPMLAAAATAFGAIGAARAWVAMNALGVALCLPLMSRALPAQDRWRWLGADVLMPSAAALAAALMVRWVTPSGAGGAGALAAIGAAYFLALLAAAAATPVGRGLIRGAAAAVR